MFNFFFRKHQQLRENDIFILDKQYRGLVEGLEKNDIALIANVYSDNLCEVYYPRVNTFMMELNSHFIGSKATFKLLET